jgi:hypothetical protein
LHQFPFPKLLIQKADFDYFASFISIIGKKQDNLVDIPENHFASTVEKLQIGILGDMCLPKVNG